MQAPVPLAVDLAVPLAVGLAVALGAAPVLALGLRAPRTARGARVGLGTLLGGAGVALVGAARSGPGEPLDVLLRAGLALVVLAGGLAHAVAFALAPLPPRARAWRRPLGWLGLGTAALWAAALLDSAGIQEQGRSGWTHVAWGALAATAVAWLVGLALARRPASVLREGRAVPSLRFACPRCGVRADWGEGGFPCPECGLFVHADWTPGAGADPTRIPDPSGARPPDAALVVRCPGCGRRAARPWGRSACAGCGAPLRLSWNVHVGSRPASGRLRSS